MVNSQFIPQQADGNVPFQYIPLAPIRYEYNELATGAYVVSALLGQSDILASIPDPNLTGNPATRFVDEVNVGDYLTWSDGFNPDTQLLARVASITNQQLLTFETPLPTPINSVAINYTNQTIYKCDINRNTIVPLLADPTQSSVSVPAPAKRFYYDSFDAWDWNTGSTRNLALEYAIANTGDVRNLGWGDLAGWQTVINTLLTFGGWVVNAITNVIPDTTTINNLNQEIVVYYQNSPYTYNGGATDSIQTLTYYEQSPAPNTYKQIIGVNPFQTSSIYFDGRDYGGIYFDTAGAINIQPPLPVLAKKGESILIGTFAITYNEAAATISFTNQDLQQGQLQVFVKYTTYDGIEGMVAKKLVEMGITVNPVNVSWYLQEIERNGNIEEIEWPFDDTDEAPKQDEPQNFDPTGDSPLDYTPPNAEKEEDENNAD
jgi:hypothetical protein